MDVAIYGPNAMRLTAIWREVVREAAYAGDCLRVTPAPRLRPSSIAVPENCSWCAMSPIWCRPIGPTALSRHFGRVWNFAVQSLKIRQIVVMGQGRCGGIKAALDPNAAPLSPGDFIGQWMGLLKPAAQQIQDSQLMTGGEPRSRWSGSRSATRSPISGRFPASRSLRTRAGWRCTGLVRHFHRRIMGGGSIGGGGPQIRRFFQA